MSCDDGELAVDSKRIKIDTSLKITKDDTVCNVRVYGERNEHTSTATEKETRKTMFLVTS